MAQRAAMNMTDCSKKAPDVVTTAVAAPPAAPVREQESQPACDSAPVFKVAVITNDFLACFFATSASVFVHVRKL
jgi:hypothetical protein